VVDVLFIRQGSPKSAENTINDPDWVFQTSGDERHQIRKEPECMTIDATPMLLGIILRDGRWY